MTQPQNGHPPVSEPDPYADLAAELHKVADQLAALAGQDVVRPRYVTLTICTGRLDYEAERGRPAVNAIAKVLGVKTKTKIDRGAYRRGQLRAEHKTEHLHVTATCDIPVPPTKAQTMADLQRENDELRAQLDAKDVDQ